MILFVALWIVPGLVGAVGFLALDALARGRWPHFEFIGLSDVLFVSISTLAGPAGLFVFVLALRDERQYLREDRARQAADSELYDATYGAYGKPDTNRR